MLFVKFLKEQIFKLARFTKKCNIKKKKKISLVNKLSSGSMNVISLNSKANCLRDQLPEAELFQLSLLLLFCFQHK